MKKRYFEFEFQFQNDDDSVVLRYLAIRLPDGAAEDKGWDLIDAMQGFLQESGVEDYGVHDFHGSHNDHYQTFGYSTYEVAAEKVSEVMEIWRGFFASHFGANAVGPVTELPQAMDYNDMSARYDFLLAAEKPALAPATKFIPPQP